MLNHEELKKKYSTRTASNNNNSSNSLISIKDYRKAPHSREKSKNKQGDHFQEYQPKPNSFKSARDNFPKSDTTAKNRPKPHPTVTTATHDPNHGISINVNIQNLITPKNIQNIKAVSREKEETTPRQHIAADTKRNKKFSNLKSDADAFEFQCTEEILYKKPSGQEGGKAKPLIDPKMVPKEFKKREKQKEKPVDHKEVLRKFQAQMNEINGNSGYESLIYLDNRQNLYLVQPDYIEKKQKNFTWIMRALVVEWIMQVCYEYSLKRETFHISINLVDRFLEVEQNLAKSDFQLVGLAAMFIASKLEQFQPKSSQKFVEAANSSYNSKQIKQMEKKICKALKFNLNPPTLYRWGNRLMLQWDTYIKNDQYAQRHPVYAVSEKIYFKECDETAYVNYRQMMQMLDCSIMDVQTFEYNPKMLVCGFMYLILGKEMQQFTAKEIVKQFPHSSLYLLDEENLFNDLFSNFLQYTFGLPLIDLLPVVQYCATYFILPPNADKPMQPSEEEAKQMQLEQYCTFQTFDRNMYLATRKRFRGVYI